MKYLHVQNIDASASLTESVVLPTEDEKKVASLMNTRGGSLVDIWYDGNQVMHSADTTQWRNRASLDKYTYSTVSGSIPPRVFSTLNGKPVLDNPGGSAGLWTNVSRKEAGDWTICFAGQLTRSETVGSNYSMFGVRTSDDLGYTNQPSFNVTQGNVIRTFSNSTNSATTTFYQSDEATIYGRPVVFVVSQSTRNGVTVRLNGAQLTRNSSATAKLPSTGTTKLALMAGGAGSAITYGKVGTILLLSEDISDNANQLQIVETYLSNRYGVV